MKRIILIFITLTGLLSSCYKAPENGIAKIIILSKACYRQPGVDVQLLGPAGSYIDEHMITDLNGEIVY
jgi:hypothetical protein